MRFLVALVLACFGLTGAAGCSDDDFGQERPPSDIGAQQFDMASADSGSSQDMARSDGVAAYACGQGFTCNNACGGDKACGQACLDVINSTNGKALFTAIQKCFSLAAVGSCAAKCGMPGQECGLCLYMACQAEIAACTLDN